MSVFRLDMGCLVIRVRLFMLGMILLIFFYLLVRVVSV